jgi:hypothetical protein
MPLIITVGIEIALRNFAICESGIEESVEVIFRKLGWRRELPRRKNGLLLKTLRRTAGTYSNG